MFFLRKKGDPYRELFDEIVKQSRKTANKMGYYDAKPNSLDVYSDILNMQAEERGEFLTAFPSLVERSMSLGFSCMGKNWQLNTFLMDVYASLMRRKNDFTPEQLLVIITTIKKRHGSTFIAWPVGWIINQLEKSIKVYPLTDETQTAWLEVSKWKKFSEEGYWGSDLKKARTKLVQLVASDNADMEEYPLGKTNVSFTIKADLAAMSDDNRRDWHTLFYTAAGASGSKPSRKYTDSMNAAIDVVGTAAFKKQLGSWLEAAVETDSFHIKGAEDSWDRGRPDPEIQNLLKGLVWGMARFHDVDSLSTIARLTEKCFERLPGIGPAAAALGNAAIYTLANSKGLTGVAHLSRLKLRIKQNNTQKLIQTNIEQQAAKRGLKAAEIEDMAAPDFGMALGIKHFSFDDYRLKLEAVDVGQASLTWFKPDGSVQKTVPAFVKEKAAYKKKLTEVRALVKEIKKASTAQRDRIDRLYTEDMSWAPEAFQDYYLDHGLIGPLARKLIWLLTIHGNTQSALLREGSWEDCEGNAITGKPEKFQLWHPIMSDTDTILAWRARLEKLQIQQPFKQTFREVYLLTDAEVSTKTYSNRMAAHLLKQHQFNTLAAIRGWKYSLLGAYDDGRDNEVAQKSLPAYGLVAEFWIDELYDMEDSFNDAGIWDYVATDQVRFSDKSGEPVDLIDVPAIILSETLRDTDLFVGVASIGNDPSWSDRGGAPRTDEYWQSFSFGDLGETAKTRKLVLESLIPRLKIRDIAKIEGKFLVVKGKRHTYKIHIGSTNILIAPLDRYLCIVPGRGKDKNVDNLYLPFEGDRGLSIVLSKAFLLADDDKITDPTILSQL